MAAAIVAIVEGKSEVESAPILLRRILHDLNADHVQVTRPFRVSRTQVVRESQLERAIQQACRDRDGVGGVLVLIDADDDCPAQLGPSLLERCGKATGLPASVVLAMRELEGWFLGAKESLRGIRGIQPTTAAPPNPESVRGAKEQVSRNMQGRRYLEVDDQRALAAEMDFEMARQRCPSFAKLFREVESLVRRIGRAEGGGM